VIKLADYVAPSPAQLSSAARAMDKLTCKQVDTFILAIEQCETVVEPAALQAALMYCEESCLSPTTDIQCSTRAVHDFIVAITVDDVNDNLPVFAQTMYKVAFVEPAVVEIGKVVTVVGASDIDTSSRVVYTLARMRVSPSSECEVVPPSSSSLSAMSTAKAQTLFACEWTIISPEDGAGILAVDAVSGAVKIAGELDYEEFPVIWLEVDASDGEHVATTWVVVRLFDRNDNEPTLQAFSPVYLSEDSPIGTTLTNHMMVRRTRWARLGPNMLWSRPPHTVSSTPIPRGE
jgi:hypothetical protein